MFNRGKQIQKFTDRVHKLYDRKFLYIEGALDSCVTLYQASYCIQWAYATLRRYKNHEKKRLGNLKYICVRSDVSEIVNKYFDLRQNIIGCVFERTVSKIQKRELTKTEE